MKGLMVIVLLVLAAGCGAESGDSTSIVPENPQLSADSATVDGMDATPSIYWACVPKCYPGECDSHGCVTYCVTKTCKIYVVED
jgi:hypothetical protein